MNEMKNDFNMPMARWLRSYPSGPYRFINREFFIISYRTDISILENILPDELSLIEPVVKFEFIRMPDSSGFGDYTESGQVVPVSYRGEEGTFTLSMFLDDQSPIAAGREIWGFPKKLAKPKLFIDNDTLVGILDYGSLRIATATMGYKHQELKHDHVIKILKQPIFLLKNIPDVSGQPLINQLTRTYLADIEVKGAWLGPSSLELHPHALAPIAKLPVLEIISAVHFVTDLTLQYGEVVEDYLKQNKERNDRS